MANVIYNSFKSRQFGGTGKIDVATDTIKVALVTSTYVPNIDTHTFFSDVTNEVVGTGYTAGGNTLTGVTVTQDNTNDRGVFDANDTTWSALTATFRGAVVYKSTGTPSTSPLIGYIDFTTDRVYSVDTATIQWNASGIVYAS